MGYFAFDYPLHFVFLVANAPDHCETERIQFLLNMGYAINSPSPHRFSPLHFAVLNRSISLEVLSFIVQKGADVNARDYRLRNPLLYLLSIASDNPHTLETSKFLLDRGTHVDVGDLKGCTALHISLRNPFGKDLIELLLNHGCSVNRMNSLGYSPLHFALDNNKLSWETIKLLIDRGAKVDVPVGKTRTMPLHLAAKLWNSKVVQLIVDNGAMVNCLNQKEESPLLLSACYNKTEVLKTLLNSGAFVSCGISPIKAVLATNNIHINEVALKNVQLLLQYALLEDAILYTDYTYGLFMFLNSVSEELSKFWIECLNEIHEMHLVTVDSQNNLAQFIFYLRFNIKRKSEIEIKTIFDKLLHLIYPDSYPLYRDIICSLMKRDYLLGTLERLVVCIPTNRPGTQSLIVLNSHVLLILAEYLTDKDLLHFVLAFYKSHDCITP